MPDNSLQIVRDVLQTEASAIATLASRLDDSVVQIVEMLFNCKGRLIFTGMGKMGQIARKATATFCSTGSPAIFLHPSDAAHGDLGIVTHADILIALSNSGETDEITALIPFMVRFSVPIVAITGNVSSSLAKQSSQVIGIGVGEEADPVTMAPTTSTTVALAVCDALAIALMTKRGFTAEQFAIFHPGGNLGRKLLLTVEQVMHSGDRVPSISIDTPISQAIVTITKKGLGAAVVVDPENRLLGIFTDGDLRRTFECTENPLQDPVGQLMTRGPTTVLVTALAAEALRLMEEKEITVLPVVDDHQRLVGIVHLHDLIRVGLA